MQQFRTTIDFDRDLMARLKQTAFAEGKTVRKLIHEAVTERLLLPQKPNEYSWRVFDTAVKIKQITRNMAYE